MNGFIFHPKNEKERETIINLTELLGFENKINKDKEKYNPYLYIHDWQVNSCNISKEDCNIYLLNHNDFLGTISYLVHEYKKFNQYFFEGRNKVYVAKEYEKDYEDLIDEGLEPVTTDLKILLSLKNKEGQQEIISNIG